MLSVGEGYRGCQMKRKRLLVAVLAACTLLVFSGLHAQVNRWESGRGQVGLASWYGKGFQGRETASGERFSVMELTAAHRNLPLGTKVLVTNLATAELVEVKINDRGPSMKRRIIDLSRAAAASIGLLQRGIGRVRVVVSEGALALRDGADEVFYEVQAGAFVELEQANELLDQLQSQYPAVHIAPRDGPLGRYYRVRIGPFDNRRDGMEVTTALTREGYYVFLDEVAASSILELRFHLMEDGRQDDFKVDDFGVEEGVALRLESATADTR